MNMSDDKPAAEVDVTKEWRATHGQESAAKRLRLFAALSWIVAIGTEIAGIVLLRQHKFDHGNLPLLIGLLVVIAIFAIAGSLMWKAANKHDPASKSEPVKFFVQNQLGAIITVLAFLPLIVLIFMDKDMDPKNKKIAGGIGVVLAAAATLIGVDFNPPSVEQYTQDMNKCAAEIKAGEGHRPGLGHGGRGNQERREPERPGCRILDRSGERRQEVGDAACLPYLPSGEPDARQDRE
jgi:hypothetical protein